MANDELFELSLAELMNIEIRSNASATPTINRLQPASVTSISQAMIRQSGAQNLLSLLEVYVPNLHYLPHHWEPSHIGLRGIIGDREDKYLLLVNGKVMNEGTHLGVMSERDFPMLSDIRRIDVMRGSGSVLYGPGAISQVIHIQTESFEHHDDASVVASLGAFNEYASVEIKNSLQFSQDHGLYAYAGFSNGDGHHDSDVIYGLSGTTAWGETVEGGKPNSHLEQPSANDYYRNQSKIKLHLDYQYHNWNAWLRYTRGGEKMSWSHKIFYEEPNGFIDSGTQASSLSEHSVGYQQLTATLDNNVAINGELHLETRISHDITDAERVLFNSFDTNKLPETHREDKTFLRALLNWQPSFDHTLATGIEYQYQQWGLKSLGYPDLPANSFVLGEMNQWTTYAYGFIFEHQWKINPTLTSFLGARLDNDQYTDSMLSPRWAIVYAPNEEFTYKAIASRSVRKNNAEELRQQYLAGETGETENITSYELSVNHSAYHHSLSATSFYNNYDILGINIDNLRSESIAQMRSAGLELEWIFNNEQWQINTSHSFTKLLDIDGADALKQKISASTSGYGNDISQWSNHISKIAAHYQLNDKTSLYSALRVFWGYDGAQDYINFSNDLRANSVDGDTTSTALTDPGYSDSTDLAAFLDMGVIYKLDMNQTIELRGYDLLGLIDKKYNKRIYVINVGNYQQTSASMSLKYQLQF